MVLYNSNKIREIKENMKLTYRNDINKINENFKKLIEVIAKSEFDDNKLKIINIRKIKDKYKLTYRECLQRINKDIKKIFDNMIDLEIENDKLNKKIRVLEYHIEELRK